MRVEYIWDQNIVITVAADILGLNSVSSIGSHSAYYKVWYVFCQVSLVLLISNYLSKWRNSKWPKLFQEILLHFKCENGNYYYN